MILLPPLATPVRALPAPADPASAPRLAVRDDAHRRALAALLPRLTVRLVWNTAAAPLPYWLTVTDAPARVSDPLGFSVLILATWALDRGPGPTTTPTTPTTDAASASPEEP